jgi:hypothetical protein
LRHAAIAPEALVVVMHGLNANQQVQFNTNNMPNTKTSYSGQAHIKSKYGLRLKWIHSTSIDQLNQQVTATSVNN